MKKIFTALLLLCGVAHASTYTPNFSLEKPGDGDTTWGAAIRDDLDIIDTQLGIDAAHIADTTAAHEATAILTTVGADVCTSSINVQQFLNCLDSNYNLIVNGGAASLAGNQTFTGLNSFSALITANDGIKVTDLTTGVVHSDLDGDLSSSLLINSDVSDSASISRSKLEAGTASHVVINDTNGVLSSEAQLDKTRGGTGVSSTATFPTSGVVVTEAATQTLTGKTLSGNTATNLISGSGTLTLNTSGTITVPDGTDTLVGKATTDTLTNKSFNADGTGNSITNIENADIKSAAAIDLNKLAATTASRALVSDGSGFVSAATTTSTEIGYVNGVTSAIQTQLDAKAASTSIVGVIFDFGGSSCPAQSVAANGASLLRAGTYANLFSAIGTTWGSADGTHFNAPNLIGRITKGAGTITDGNGGSASTLGTFQDSANIAHTHAVGTLANAASRLTTSGGLSGNLEQISVSNAATGGSTYAWFMPGGSGQPAVNVGAQTISGSTASTGGTDTQVKTYGVLKCIWY